MELVEERQAGTVAPYGFAVEHRLEGPEGRHGLADAGISVRPVEAVAGEKTHAALAFAGYEPVTVVLDLMNPLRPDRRLCCSGRDARLDIAEPLCGAGTTCSEGGGPLGVRQGQGSYSAAHRRRS